MRLHLFETCSIYRFIFSFFHGNIEALSQQLQQKVSGNLKLRSLYWAISRRRQNIVFVQCCVNINYSQIANTAMRKRKIVALFNYSNLRVLFSFSETYSVSSFPTRGNDFSLSNSNARQAVNIIYYVVHSQLKLYLFFPHNSDRRNFLPYCRVDQVCFSAILNKQGAWEQELHTMNKYTRVEMCIDLSIPYVL